MGDSGDKAALVELYGIASAWVRGGTRSTPEPLASWIADRLCEVSNVLHQRRQFDVGRLAGSGERVIEAELAVALKARRTKRGRAPSNRSTQFALLLAQDVLHFMQMENLLPAQAIARVVEYNAEKKMPVPAGIKTYEAAWTKHGSRLMENAGMTFRDPRKN